MTVYGDGYCTAWARELETAITNRTHLGETHTDLTVIISVM